MTAFDATLNVSNITIEKPENANHLAISLEVGQILPTQGSQAIMIPIGTFRFPIPRDKAIRFGEDLKSEAEKMPKPSDLAIASNLDEVNVAASGLDSLKRKK